MLASGFEGIGMRARSALRLPGLRTIDGLLGAALTACVGLGIAWIVGAVALHSAGSQPLRRDIQRSAILRELNQLLPPSGPILHALARFDPLPSVRGPAADVPAPTRGILATPRRAGRAAERRARRRHGVRARDRGQRLGRGAGLVVTNAHVVAGETDTVVQVGGRAARICRRGRSRSIPTTTSRSCTVPGLLAAGAADGLRSDARGRPPRSSATRSTARSTPSPAGSARPSTVSTEDAYGNGPRAAQITSLRGRVRPGNSGGPMVDAAGKVVATVFAAITGSSSGARGGFAVPNALVRKELALARSRDRPGQHGACAG